MAIDKSLISGNTDMLVLRLLKDRNMYGYQIIEELARQSNRTFELKAGTLYPLLHLLEQKNYLESYDGETVAGKTRKYYKITDSGCKYLELRQADWESYTLAVNNVLSGGVLLAGV
ncbi:MAG: helix-turn-helix transcriptional regulator [Clostridia bacterium]|nr:helix-turn-helix transcriptional regulator [Alphaproteobacteria bacterium]MBR7132113.1 helix-turn-helix transcriptional regulator [Clostridia bacterium]